MLIQDIRHSFRLLVKSPGFTAVAVLSIGLGIGVNTAMFSFHDAILLRPLPVRDPATVLSIAAATPEESVFQGRLSYPNYRDLRDKSRSFDGLVASQLMLFSFARSHQATREMRMGILISENCFNVLGVQPPVGRGFRAEEGAVAGRDAVVVLGYDFWTKTLGGDPSILNSVVSINGIDFTVIGIAPESFTGLDQFVRPSFYVPLMMTERLSSSGNNPLADRQIRSWEIKGRLKSGVSQQAAQAEMTGLWSELQRQFPDSNNNRVITVRTEFEHRLKSRPANGIIGAMNTTLAAAVLIIACANVANLLLGRARGRSREMAIRLALGVGRVRLLRQLLTESLLLAIGGGALGIALAYSGIRFLANSAQAVVPIDLPIVISARLDQRVLFFSLVAAVASALLFGLAPAWQSLKTELVAGLKNSELSEAGRVRTFGRNLLVVGQIAISMVLLVAAGMLQAGFRKTLTMEPGFRTDHLITMGLDTSFTRYTSAQTHEFYRNLVERVRVLPGVRSVTLANPIPLNRGFGSSVRIVPEGFEFPPGQVGATVMEAVVAENYFGTMNTDIIRGHGFMAADDDRSPPIAIVNETFAQIYWPNQDPLGKRVRLNNSQAPWMEIVGVSRNEKYANVLEPPLPFLYLPFAQNEMPQMSLLVETVNGDAAALAAPLRDVVRTLDVNQPVFSLQTFSSFYAREGTGVQLLVLRVASGMGVLGLILALIGLYGLVAYSVSRRTREFGIRIAVGAGRIDVLTMVIRQGLKLSFAGILVGAVASILVGRLLTSAMAGLGVANLSTYVVVPLLLIGLTLAASYIPARRASNISPLRALRYE
jgi:putative ABC transport system permease protein